MGCYPQPVHFVQLTRCTCLCRFPKNQKARFFIQQCDGGENRPVPITACTRDSDQVCETNRHLSTRLWAHEGFAAFENMGPPFRAATPNHVAGALAFATSYALDVE